MRIEYVCDRTGPRSAAWICHRWWLICFLWCVVIYFREPFWLKIKKEFSIHWCVKHCHIVPYMYIVCPLPVSTSVWALSGTNLNQYLYSVQCRRFEIVSWEDEHWSTYLPHRITLLTKWFPMARCQRSTKREKSSRKIKMT